jgi:S-(hydroxymethyl)glutathione dehydrogenase / alcohol dehydrogenase
MFQGMKAACLRDGSNDLTIDEISIGPLGPRDVLIKTAAVGLCHSDLHVIDGTLQRPRPLVMGHEGVGTVEAIGELVTSVAVGAHVVSCLVMGCGACRRCEMGEPALCANPTATRRAGRLNDDGAPMGQMANIGALGEYMVIDERGAIAIPDDMPDHLAAILGCAVVTGLGAVFNVAKVQATETVVAIGCGGIGLSVIQAARIAGASRVIAVDLSDTKLALARTLGATDTINSSTDDATAAVLALTGDGVDYAFECVGRPALAEQAIDMVAPGRTAYIVGMLPDGSSMSVSATALRKGKSVVGVFMGLTRPRVDIPRYVTLWQRGLLDLDSMVSHVLEFDQVNEGFASLARGDVARAVVRIAAAS